MDISEAVGEQPHARGVRGSVATNSRDRENTVLAAIAEQLRIEVARQQLTLHELSRRSGVPYPTVQKSLKGRRMIDVVELARMCYALGVKPSVLFDRIPADAFEPAPDD